MKLSDYIAKRLLEYGVKDVFMITGGGAMHLNDSFGKCQGMNYVCNHHEQASAIAAEGYARTSGKIGVVVVTTGPGGTNTLTGVIGQWFDSVPVLYISGQVKYETTTASCRNVGLRQLGDQELRIVDIVRPVTKYAAMVEDPLQIRYQLEKALYLATHGRPGPVWLDIPLNVQGAFIEEKKLAVYNPKEDGIVWNEKELRLNIARTIEMLQKSERPVFVAGHGIRISGGQDVFLQVVEQLKIPILSTFNGADIIESDHSCFIGRIGTVGNRAGNFALQNADLLLSVGSRNNIRQISYNWPDYAKNAKKIIVDIDLAELRKPTIKPDLAVWSDARLFLEQLRERFQKEHLPDWSEWLRWCQERKRRYPPVLPEHKTRKGAVDLYYFNHALTSLLKKDAVVVAANGSACIGLFQAGIVKRGQRMFWNSGCAGMGYELPAAIGACIARGKKEVICLAGDGSLQFNIQELQTVVHHRLPIKIFYLNNRGYASIKQTQDSFFGGARVGADRKSGVSFPDILKVAKAYGFKTRVLNSHRQIKEKIARMLDTSGYLLCDVRLPSEYMFAPKVSSERKPDGQIVSKPLEDMFPFLDRAELASNRINKKRTS